ncbi:hypothetical protein AALK94_09335 [Bacteroides faecichinchillae]|uniref:Uncharacterized protein n=1 Tax=Bacteroides faecichinchillae TaxID=871325 RepID=A0A1M5FB14_9BACE|nr:hypothetical protein [Bacteroides faecichinchillae]THG68519.1 hypothetical protein E5981_05095 [Bacteroides faecichinchillae]SHF88793.1 hypothetical protein SAMN05444349_1433 [Bacteroides faecichinchillae]
MNTIRKLFSMICIIAYLIPAYGQNDTLTTDGLYLKYNTPYYRGSGVMTLTMERIKNKDLYVGPPNDSDMIRGELDRATTCIGLAYKALPQYIISETFGLSTSQTNPRELLWTAGTVITSQWIHEDGECILFIKCNGGRPNKSFDKLPENNFNWIKHTLGMGSFLTDPTEEEMERIKKKITMWPPEKAKETFNAQYVITYPIKNKKAVYMGKYTHKLELIMIKWGGNLTVSFLVTKKGNKNIEKYIKDVEEAFWFED